MQLCTPSVHTITMAVCAGAAIRVTSVRELIKMGVGFEIPGHRQAQTH